MANNDHRKSYFILVPKEDEDLQNAVQYGQNCKHVEDQKDMRVLIHGVI